MEQIHTAGVDEYLQPDGVAVIEWAERMFPASPPGSKNRSMARRVSIEIVDNSTRRITYEDSVA
jgi:tRNA A37 threonylcarbamoyladenosine biosynthesis protein TsaE